MWTDLVLIGVILLISGLVIGLCQRIKALKAELEVAKFHYKKTLDFVRYERLSNNIKKTVIFQLREKITYLLDQNDNNRS